MEAFTYKGISDGKYVEGDIEAINLDEASHLLKEKKIIITNIIKSKKKAGEKKKKSGSSLFGKSKKVKVEDILIFSKQFANCLENIRISSTFTFLLLPKSEDPLFFFFSPAFFLDLIIFVIIIFFSFNKCEASSRLIASISPSTYFPSDIPL